MKPYWWMTAIVEIEMVAVDADTVEPRQNTRDVRGILPRRTDQILLHNDRNTKNHVTASALTKWSPTGSIFLYLNIPYIYHTPPEMKKPGNL